jgi:hypothetical protein
MEFTQKNIHRRMGGEQKIILVEPVSEAMHGIADTVKYNTLIHLLISSIP